MSRANPLWGAPRIHGELLKLGIDIGETSVSKYMVRQRKSPSQTWRTFLDNHVQQIVSVDFFTVPTIRFQVPYVFLVLAHERRRILHFNVTAHPAAEWTAQQLRNAFPWETAPRYLLRNGIRQHVYSAPVAPTGVVNGGPVRSGPHHQRAMISKSIHCAAVENFSLASSSVNTTCST